MTLKGDFERGVMLHEWGHYLVALLLGRAGSVQRFEFYNSDDLTHFWGHNVREWGKPTPTDEETLLILYGGCVACKVAGIGHKSIEGSDKVRAFKIADTPAKRREAVERVTALLEPYRGLLLDLVAKTFDYCRQDPEEVVWLQKDILEEWTKTIAT